MASKEQPHGRSRRGEGVVFMQNPAGVNTVLYTFSGVDGVNPACAPVRDSAGNLSGTASLGGTNGGGVIFELTPQ